ncbi:SusC/RagA family TonB-linked outer membrane protein [Saccharicrinis fermentans]|nr:SusC/RagA family TonB-linked outer membrane protein [Saccharicrinis fermentans]
MMKSFLSLFLLVFLVSATLVAQHKVTGKVIDEMGDPVPGVNVIEKGNNVNGTITNIDGVYTLEAESGEASLTFSFIGFKQQEVAIAGQSVVNVTLISDITGLDEVVVTALGIKREKKALGYAVQDVKAEQLTQSGDANLVSSLQGKVAGVQINQAGTGVGGTSRIEIRGASSLSDNNSPLWIVDGVPFDDGNSRNGSEWGGTSRAGGAFDLNPEDIESVSVLKGPSAAALYGERGGNGVILVTTKKGTKGSGLGINYAGSVTISEAAYMLDLQEKYGQGTDGEYSNEAVSSWGPEMEGQMFESWTGETIPFEVQKDRLKDFTRTGVSQNHNISMHNGNDDGSYRVSVGKNMLEGIYEGHEVDKTSFDLRADYNINSWLNVDTKFSYFLTEGKERPEIGNYSYVSYFNTMPMNIRNQDLEPGYDIIEAKHVEKLYTTAGPNYRNPYFLQAQTTNEDTKNRFFGYAAANITITSDLKAKFKYGMDFFNFRATEGYLYSDNVDSSRRPSYRSEQSSFKEENYEFLLSYNKQLNEDFQLGLNVGANTMNRYERGLSTSSGKLSSEDDYFLEAGANIEAWEDITEQETRSIYGFGQLAYRGMLYLDLTARNDWSSTLTAQDADFDNSYFYPSVSLSGIVSEMIALPSWVSFAKLRGSWAKVGKATDPYQTSENYTLETWNYGYTIGNVPITQVFKDLKPELSTSWELGADVRLFNGRIGLDMTYYNEETKNQILEVEGVQSSGYPYRLINAGLIQNKGLEVMLSTVPIKTNDFKLGLDFNFAKNKGTLEELEDKNDPTALKEFTFGRSIWAVEGGKLGDIRGTIYVRDDQGRLVVGEDDGLPIRTESSDNVIGNMQADWTGSINLRADYKGIFLGALVSVQQGGDVVSLAEQGATSAGTAKRTLKDDRMSFFVDGVTADGSANHTITTAEDYFSHIATVDEEFVYDASHMKLKEVVLGYNIPQSFFNKIPNNPVKSARISFVGRNLLYFYKDTPYCTRCRSL